ncbi:MAG TPA: hypothetical protein VKA57_10220 [Solirubrobacteraceae bacterium]|nr:hypothetical protein [Solirubrobacteraceae bacterium]
MLTLRRLKPGAEAEFARAWAPERWSSRMVRAYHLRRQDDPLEVITLAFFEGEAAEIEAMRDEPQWMAGEERRLRKIAPLEETVGLTGVFDVVEEVQAAGVRAH